MPKWFACEVIGTFIMVFLGLGIVAATITSDATTGIFQIAAVWGLGLTTRNVASANSRHQLCLATMALLVA